MEWTMPSMRLIDLSSRSMSPSWQKNKTTFKKKKEYKTKRESKTKVKPEISIEQYLEKISSFAGSEYGARVRTQFKDISGSSELAMLASPTTEELEELNRAVAIMTPNEKQHPENLTDEQIQRIASDAKIDPANLAIFINGYILHCKRVS